MNIIETKYLDYCKLCGIVGPAPRQVPTNKLKTTYRMKTNTTNVILTAVFVSVIALTATSKSAFDFSLLAAGIGYTAVAIMAAVAAVDYRMSNKKSATR